MVTVENGQTELLYDKYPLLLWIVPVIFFPEREDDFYRNRKQL